jgi:hypothetical protein
VTVGETIADDNPDIKQDMYDACKEARAAGNINKHYCMLIVQIIKFISMQGHQLNDCVM